MNLLHKPPMGQKPGPKVSDPDHLARVARLTCCICDAFGERQESATQAHHPIHDRYGTLKVSDEMAIPLCEGHHQGLVDRSKLAIHQGKETWRSKYGADHDWIAATKDRLGI